MAGKPCHRFLMRSQGENLTAWKKWGRGWTLTSRMTKERPVSRRICSSLDSRRYAGNTSASVAPNQLPAASNAAVRTALFTFLFNIGPSTHFAWIALLNSERVERYSPCTRYTVDDCEYAAVYHHKTLNDESMCAFT